jgi:hypothetical protein
MTRTVPVVAAALARAAALPAGARAHDDHHGGLQPGNLLVSESTYTPADITPG